MEWFVTGSLAGMAIVIAAAASLRGRLFAMFASVILTLHTLSSLGVARMVFSSDVFSSDGGEAPTPWAYVLAYLQVTVYVHLLLLARPRMRPLAYRALVSVPASYFMAGTFLALPWAALSAFGVHAPAPWLPYAVASVGLLQSMFSRPEEIDISVTGEPGGTLGRRRPGGARVDRPLKLVQITDPHLGPFMSESRLRRLCERAVARDPDLVLLTGDYLTMESSGDPGHLQRALMPLATLRGRVFACRGNHDLEAPTVVEHALEAVGITLLVDDEAVVDTPAGRVQILGLDFSFRHRRERIEDACRAHPRRPDAFRLVLLHDPGAFKHVPDGEADLVLSGHTHGGQLGLLSLGLQHTAVSALSTIPDHGLWGQGENLLYVHRGTGHYGFPLRVGVPAEDSLVRVHDLRES